MTLLKEKVQLEAELIPHSLKYRPIVIVGRPGVGKSTVLQSVSSALQIPVCHEVGASCRQLWHCAPQPMDGFDCYVMLSELASDILLGHLHPGRPVLLEQWHFGNLAHAKTRSDRAYQEYLEALNRYDNACESPCVWLREEGTRPACHYGAAGDSENCRKKDQWEVAFEDVVAALGLKPMSVAVSSVAQAAEEVAVLLKNRGCVNT